MKSSDYQLSTINYQLVVIVGPTASGKSELAMKVAQDFNGEIIAADSWTVYRGFDIGTSKPSEADQKAVRHHLIDIREANQGFNAPLFKDMAEKAITDIRSRGKLPILAGGTGLYIDSVLYDYGFLDNSSPAERKKLDAMELPDLVELAKEQGIDLKDIDTRNKRRIIRAIESGGQKPTKGQLRPGTLIIGLKVDNNELKKKIEKRVDKMVADGFEEEVRTLANKFGWDIEPMKGIGYRAFQDYIEGRESLEEAKQKFIKGDMGLAKRQRTWFKRNPAIKWFASVDDACAYLEELFYNPKRHC